MMATRAAIKVAMLMMRSIFSFMANGPAREQAGAKSCYRDAAGKIR